MEPGNLRIRDGASESHVGCLPANRRRVCRPLRSDTSPGRRRHHLCGGPGAHVGVAHSGPDLPVRWIARRRRHSDGVVLHRHGGVRQARSSGEAVLGLRYRHRGRLDGASHLRAAGPGLHRRLWMADGTRAAGFDRSPGHPLRHSPECTARHRGCSRRSLDLLPRGDHGSVRALAAMSCWCSDSSCAGFRSPS